MLPWQTVRMRRRFSVRVAGAATLALGIIAAINSAAGAEEPRTYPLDPFTQATGGYPDCPAAKPPVLTEQEMRTTAHQRVERGTSCCLAATCECGEASEHDPEINDRVAQAVRDDRRFRDTSVWVTTTRKFVTLEGCVRSAAQKKALERLVKRLPDVAIVWNETTVGAKRPAKNP
jgi:hypothetical protein